MLSFAYKRFAGVISEPGDPSRSSAQGLDNEDRALQEKVEAGFETVGDLYNACKFRAAPSVPSGLPRGNRGGQAWARRWPWPARRTVTHARTRCGPRACSREATAKLTLRVSPGQKGLSRTVILRVVDNLKMILAPIPPHSPVLVHRTQKLHEHLGYEGRLFGTQQVVEYEEETRSHRALTYDHTSAVGTWVPGALPAVQPLRQPPPLFKKLDEGVIEEEYARLEG